MNRKTLLSLAVFAVLGLVAVIALTPPRKGRTCVRRAAPDRQLNPSDFDTLEVTQGRRHDRCIEEEGGKYKVISPVAYAADEDAAKAAFEAMEKLEFATSSPTRRPSRPSSRSATTACTWSPRKAARSWPISSSARASAPAPWCASGQGRVWQASGISSYTFDKAPADWRDKSITTFTRADAEQHRDQGQGRRQGSSRRPARKAGTEDKWTVVESSVTIPKLDNASPNGIASALAIWKANDFADDVKPGRRGPRAAGADRHRGAQGRQEGDRPDRQQEGRRRLLREDRRGAAGLPGQEVQRRALNKRPIEFRDKTFCDIADSDLTEIAVTHGDDSYTLVKSGKDWKATKPAKTDVDRPR